MSTKNTNPVLDKIQYEDFVPVPLLSHPISQTLLAHYRPPYSDNLKGRKHYISLPDHDVLVLIENTPQNWQPNGRIVVLVHGLTGSHLSNYNIRICQALLEKGYKVIRVNLRGCGPGLGLARIPHHAGNSNDTQFVLHWIVNHYPQAKLTQLGFSLGGNITLKMLGESHILPLPSQLDSCIAVSPPVDILSCSLLLSEDKNKLFDQFFVKHLLHLVNLSHKHFSDLPELELPKNLTVSMLNELYIAPRAGFKNALDYYTRCSAGPLLKNIQLPTFILHAEDDPFIPMSQYLLGPQNPNIDLLLTKAGGHMGWLGIKKVDGRRRIHEWMDEAIIRWIDWFDSRRHHC